MTHDTLWIRRFVLVLGAVCLAAAPWAPLEAVDFLRGDANDDGAVSFADARRTLDFLFLGQARPPCLDAADMNDSGRLDITDAIHTLNYLVLGGAPPAAPFPAIGADPTEETDDGGGIIPDCESYGDGSPLADAAAVMRIETTASAGGEDDQSILTIFVSSSAAISGYSGAIAIDTDVVYGASVMVDLTGTEQNTGFNVARVLGNQLRFGFLPSLVTPAEIPAGDDVAVAQMALCLAEETRAGSYPLELIQAELVDAASARAIYPMRSGTTLVVESDLAEGSGCRFVPPVDPPDDPADIDAAFRIGDGSAPPGGSVTLPFFILSTAETQAFSTSIDFDETLLVASDVVQSFAKPDGSEWGFYTYDLDSRDEITGSSGIAEGFVIAAAVMSFTDNQNNIPANAESEVLGIVLTVRENAPPGEITPIQFIDGAQGSGQAVDNATTSFGTRVDPSTAKSFLMIQGFMGVVADITLFVRGDTTGDTVVNIGDAQATLNYLFLGSDTPHCLDAADANDDGQLNVADPVMTLQHLFLGGPQLPPPNGEPAVDPTPDRLRCLQVVD